MNFLVHFQKRVQKYYFFFIYASFFEKKFVSLQSFLIFNPFFGKNRQK